MFNQDSTIDKILYEDIQKPIEFSKRHSLNLSKSTDWEQLYLEVLKAYIEEQNLFNTKLEAFQKTIDLLEARKNILEERYVIQITSCACKDRARDM